jgi:hypothetical protein
MSGYINSLEVWFNNSRSLKKKAKAHQKYTIWRHDEEIECAAFARVNERFIA